MSDGNDRGLPEALRPEFDPPTEQERATWPAPIREYVEHIEGLVERLHKENEKWVPTPSAASGNAPNA